MIQPSPHDRADRCPGVFMPHAAADGAVARIRLPGGRILPEQLAALAAVAADHGDGYLELTARANLQLRGITDPAAVADAVRAAGLAPSTTHDNVRNIAVSPLTGRIGGHADVRPVVALLDDQLRADATLAALSGRFLFGLDDGRGDIVGRRPDAAAVVRAKGSAMVADVLAGGVPMASVAGADAIVRALLSVGRSFIEVAGESAAWRMTDLTSDQHADVVARAATGLPSASAPVDTRSAGRREPIVGWFTQDDGAVLLGGVVELGRMDARLAEFIAAIGAEVVFTPDREVLICDLSEAVADTVVRVLAPLGLIFDTNSPWTRVTCCVGAPGCAKALAPVRADLLAWVRDGGAVGEREHWVGCARSCGSPTGGHTHVEATPDGDYRRTGSLGLPHHD